MLDYIIASFKPCMKEQSPFEVYTCGTFLAFFLQGVLLASVQHDFLHTTLASTTPFYAPLIPWVHF